MRIIMSAIWSILISAAIAYVLTSMAGEQFTLTGVFAVAAIIFVIVVLVSEVGLKEEKSN